MPVTTYHTVNGQLLGENRNGVFTTYIPDTLGNLIECRNDAGTKTYEAEYYPYGEIEKQSGTNPSPWGFVGLLGYFQDMPGLLYVRARHYSATGGRWTTVDPLWPSESAYRYCNNAPNVLTDSSGLKPTLEEALCCLKVAAVGALAGCLAGAAEPCWICLGTALILCAAWPAFCAGFLQTCTLICKAAVVRCIIGAIIGALTGFLACLAEGKCHPKPDEMDPCIRACLHIPPGRAHYCCMKGCRENLRYVR